MSATRKPPDHVQRARRAWRQLVLTARKSRRPHTITYGVLSAKQNLHWRSAAWFLGVIQQHCDEKGLPKLQALAVNKRTGLPGSGYIGSRRAIEHALEVARVRRRRWPLTAPF